MKSNINGNPLSNLNDDEILLNNLLSVSKGENSSIEKLKNKLWKCFLLNDGSMTQMLKILFEKNINSTNNDENKSHSKKVNSIKLNLITETKIQNPKSNLSSTPPPNILNLNILQQLSGAEIEGQEILERKINFITNKENKVIMIGLSYWDIEEYTKIYSSKEEESKPIGLIIREKEIEYYKTITNFTNLNFIYRISVYKINKKVAFILLEIFDLEALQEFFGNFE